MTTMLTAMVAFDPMKLATEIREIREAVMLGRKLTEMGDADRGELTMTVTIARTMEARLPVEMRRAFLDECGLRGAEVKS